MSVGVIGDRCDSRNVISVGQCCVGSVGVIEHDGFFISRLSENWRVRLCCCAGIKVFVVVTNVMTSSSAGFVLGMVLCLYLWKILVSAVVAFAVNFFAAARDVDCKCYAT